MIHQVSKQVTTTKAQSTNDTAGSSKVDENMSATAVRIHGCVLYVNRVQIGRGGLVYASLGCQVLTMLVWSKKIAGEHHHISRFLLVLSLHENTEPSRPNAK
jgi:hypothetical protein